jgi:hypothetical protein
MFFFNVSLQQNVVDYSTSKNGAQSSTTACTNFGIEYNVGITKAENVPYANGAACFSQHKKYSLIFFKSLRFNLV